MQTEIGKIKKYTRAANYLTVTQIYLQDNFLLERPLESKDIKPKLFGHWGTCPGINYVYAHANYLIKKHNQSAIFVLGPGHGMPGLQANLFLEGTLEKYYPEAKRDEKGIEYISKMFSWPYGFSSHCSPETPGLILEGGELGYSLASAYGAVLDNPELLAICLIGDGEAETGAMAAAWHINKLMDPATNGAVLPILHVNGLKISGPTIFGRMSDEELKKLFEGYGYEVLFADQDDKNMMATMEYAYGRIREIQQNACSLVIPSEARVQKTQNTQQTRASDNQIVRQPDTSELLSSPSIPKLSLGRDDKTQTNPRWPMIILKTPKGWTTVKEFRGKEIEGTIVSHQVVMPNVKNDEEELKALEVWLLSYHFEELFDKKTGFDKDILDLIPEIPMGDNPHMFGKAYTPLVLPDPKKLAKDVETIGQLQSNAMRMAGTYMKEVFRLNEKQKNFRLFSPDETYSNRVDDVFSVTSRAWSWPIEKGDKDILPDGRVMEMLSEHNMHGLAQGYVLTGRHAVFTTYEAFAQIFSSMAHMYQKFLKYVRKMEWREDIASLNYLLTSVCWRQEHNGYSHQNPSFVSGMLEKHNDFVKAYFPADDNSMLAVMEETMASKNQMNIITAGKTPEPRWLTYEQAKESLKDGLLTWGFASDENPHMVVVGIGDYMTKEALAAIELVKKDIPEFRIRFVNIVRLQAAHEQEEKPQIPNAEKYFTVDKPVIVNFHGYPETMKAILFNVKNPQRFSVHGYREWGGTTTPFDMQVRNHTDRYHLAMEIVGKGMEIGICSKEKGEKIIGTYGQALDEHHEYIMKIGADPLDIEQWQWSGKPAVKADVDQVMQTDLLKNARTIAVIGLSDNPERHSYRVAKYFQSKGFRIIPINPNVSEVLGEKAYASLLDIPKHVHIDIVDIFRRPDEVMPHLNEIVERGGINSVWLQEGVSSQEAEDFADDYGLTMVTNFCIMEAYKKVQSSK